MKLDSMIEFYSDRLTRKENMLNRLQLRNNDLDSEMSVSETIKLNVYQAEIRLLKEVLEDLKSC